MGWPGLAYGVGESGASRQRWRRHAILPPPDVPSRGILPRISSGFSGCQVTRMSRASNARCFPPWCSAAGWRDTRAIVCSAATSTCVLSKSSLFLPHGAGCSARAPLAVDRAGILRFVCVCPSSWIRLESTPVPAMPVHVEVARQAAAALPAPQPSTHHEVAVLAIASAGPCLAGQLRQPRRTGFDQRWAVPGTSVHSALGTARQRVFCRDCLACNALVFSIVETSNVGSVVEDVIDRADVPPARPVPALGGRWCAPLPSGSPQGASATYSSPRCAGLYPYPLWGACIALALARVPASMATLARE